MLINTLFIGATRPIARLARSAVSEAPSQYLGPLRLPASFTLNAFAQICAKVRKWGFPYVSRVRAREAMRPFLNNGTTFTTCKPIAPQRPRPSEQSPKTPRIARAKLELGARSRAKPASLLTRPSLARARTELCGFCGSDKKRHARACARGLSAKLYRLRRFPADLSTVSKRRR